MTKRIAFLLAIIVCLTSLFACGDDKAIPDHMGDADGNGMVDRTDLELLESYLNGGAAEICYEFCDLNGDFAVDTADAELLEAYLDGKRVQIVGTPFARENEDITDELFDLGINNEKAWEIDTNSRNPFDMISSNGVVMISGGNYSRNTGPVVINGYSRGVDEPIYMGELDSEQINRFYDCGNYITAVSIDQRSTWAFSDLFIKPYDSNTWGELNNVLAENIHCYDMVYFNGSYFFCGSSVSYEAVNGKRVEVYKPSIYKADAPLREDMTAEDFVELEAYNEAGYPIDYDASNQFDDRSRFYELVVLGENLYAICFNGYPDGADERYNNNGIYLYNEDSEDFNCAQDLNNDDTFNLLMGKGLEGETIQHDFAFGNGTYFINSKLFYTEDFKEYSQVKMTGYEEYEVRDVIFRGDNAYLLINEKLDDCFINVVLETSDFESFRPILHFESSLFARSFEFCNGEFYFALGYTGENHFFDSLNDAGRVLRYTYYK